MILSATPLLTPHSPSHHNTPTYIYYNHTKSKRKERVKTLHTATLLFSRVMEEFFQFKWVIDIGIIFTFRSHHLKLNCGVPSHILFQFLNKMKWLFNLVCETQIQVRNSVDWGEGIRHPLIPLFLTPSLSLTYTSFKFFFGYILYDTVSLILLLLNFYYS